MTIVNCHKSNCVENYLFICLYKKFSLDDQGGAVVLVNGSQYSDRSGSTSPQPDNTETDVLLQGSSSERQIKHVLVNKRPGDHIVSHPKIFSLLTSV